MGQRVRTDPETSRRMAGIRQKGTAAELLVRSALSVCGVAYRLNVRSLPGSPDLANKHRKFAVFVQGCFWHGHPGCKRATIPKRNESFWRAKFAANKARDALALQKLKRMGYRTVVIWECETAEPEKVSAKLQMVMVKDGRNASSRGVRAARRD